VPSVPVAIRLVSASDLKRQRGWTEGLITTLLGAPDALAPNPHGFRSPMRFFVEDRVLGAERESPFVRWSKSLDDRRAWRRAQPTRVHLSGEVDHLEWLDDPWRLALFLAPRIARRPRRRPPRDRPEPVATTTAPAKPLRFEALRLFDIDQIPTAPVVRRGSRARSGSASA
jgi:hypothetical protein